jgi:hypothetical protein
MELANLVSRWNRRGIAPVPARHRLKESSEPVFLTGRINDRLWVALGVDGYLIRRQWVGRKDVVSKRSCRKRDGRPPAPRNRLSAVGAKRAKGTAAKGRYCVESVSLGGGVKGPDRSDVAI